MAPKGRCTVFSKQVSAQARRITTAKAENTHFETANVSKSNPLSQYDTSPLKTQNNAVNVRRECAGSYGPTLPLYKPPSGARPLPHSHRFWRPKLPVDFPAVYISRCFQGG